MQINNLNQIDLTDINACVFDCFGTLIEITNKQKPYKYLYEQLNNLNLKIDNYAHFVMTRPLTLEDIENKFNIKLSNDIKNEFYKRLNLELDSICLFPETLEFLNKLKNLSIPSVLCSNLAQPYGKPAKELKLDINVLSYDVGLLKPDLAIFELCHKNLDIKKETILFVGDTFKDDYEGSLKYGFQSAWIKREKINKKLRLNNGVK